MSCQGSNLNDNSEPKDAVPSVESMNMNEDLPDCKESINEKNIDDPFDLFSDDDTQPKRYQPIKRKLTQAVLLAEDQIVDHPNSETLEKVLPLTMEIADCKRMKLAGRVTYVHSKELLQRVNRLTRIESRADLVHSLVQAYGLLQYVDVIPPRVATEAEILGFHSSDYIEFLKDVSAVSDVEENQEDPHDFYTEAEAYGLSYDCPLQDGIFETASLISGASIVAADTLISGQADIAINWYGGWHHAKRDSASGFCYINDIVLAILKLREKFDKVLYVDIDLHHGDGVEEAFSLTSKVMTVSFHKYATGFFPGSGSVDNVGQRRGQFYTVNIPLQDGIKDAEFCSTFYRIMKVVKEKFSPEAVVLQCGADGLSEDHMASFNLTHVGLAKCVCFVLAWNLPTLLLGGGGYNFASTAKCWTFLTALAARRKLPLEIPEHENLLAYGPDYQMTTTVGNKRDCNSKQYLMNLVAKILKNLEKI
ncbi:histone deacetylase [Elysia marginata]|uniref:Histone deacetylase 8 n=1 Tax=Elysia marginata TaxID=1093978 RepID=A0AAV4F036_9GAST|nr:histone deacetylase [Elysia marginata]